MENEGYETIDLLEVLNAVRQHLLAVILATVILAAAGFGISKFLITPQYEAPRWCPLPLPSARQAA